MMTDNSITVQEALALISDGNLSSGIKVDFTDVQVEALDAVRLGEAGIDVPAELIYYDDDAIEDDDAFDGPWEEINSDLEEERKWLRFEMRLDPKIKDWLNSSDVDVNQLVEKLLRDAYQTAQLLQKQ